MLNQAAGPSSKLHPARTPIPLASYHVGELILVFKSSQSPGFQQPLAPLENKLGSRDGPKEAGSRRKARQEYYKLPLFECLPYSRNSALTCIL